MPAGLDEISRQIGRLEAEASASQQHRTTIASKLDEIKEAPVPLSGLPARIDTHCRDIDNLKIKANRMTGAIWAVGGICSLATLLASNAKSLLQLFSVSK